MRVDNVKLSRMKACARFNVTRAALAVLWLFAAIPALILFIRLLSLTHFLLVGSLVIAVLVFTLLSGTQMRQLTAFLGFSVAGQLYDGFSVNSLMDWAHFVLFFLCGLASPILFRKFGGLFSVSIIALGAISIEAMQLLSLDRSPSLSDLFLDLAGWLIGVIAVLAYGWLLRFRSFSH